MTVQVLMAGKGSTIQPRDTARPLGPNADLIGKPGSRQLLQTPTLLIDLDVLERNIQRMADFGHALGVSLRPHAKTHKSIEIARRQIEAGAVGVCAATLGEAEVLVGGRIPNVLVTTPVVGAAKIARLLSICTRAQGLVVVADDPGNVETLADAAEAANFKIPVAVALDVGIHRIGAATPELAAALARQIDRSRHLIFVGVHAYAGTLQHIEDYDERRTRAASEHAKVAHLIALLNGAGIAPSFVSGSGTGTHEIDAETGLFTELQVGSYIFTDVEYNVVSLRRDEPRPFKPSLFVRTTVVSASHTGFVITDGGTKRFAIGGAMPEVAAGVPAAKYGFTGDEHGKLILLNPKERLPVGSAVELIPPHCDPTVNLYDVYHVVRGDTLVDIWPVDARGVI